MAKQMTVNTAEHNVQSLYFLAVFSVRVCSNHTVVTGCSLKSGSSLARETRGIWGSLMTRLRGREWSGKIATSNLFCCSYTEITNYT